MKKKINREDIKDIVLKLKPEDFRGKTNFAKLSAEKKTGVAVPCSGTCDVI